MMRRRLGTVSVCSVCSVVTLPPVSPGEVFTMKKTEADMKEGETG
jgi:hypothetical protein